jgi:hypothetical protein
MRTSRPMGDFAQKRDFDQKMERCLADRRRRCFFPQVGQLTLAAGRAVGNL